uniref:RNase H type-1 domain-containing protein n=1 Tax=Nicotiana tabacum TaxID=4097 RepID=A0A1S4CI27_TOBAC|nr:PREDICTED: uncharacterized protein LOC107819248 [Nicotiana tabacum]
MTNNEAEYEAVIARLKLALKYGAWRLVIHCDSQLVVNQVIGTFQIKEQRLQRYQSEIHKLLPEFDECRLVQILRAQNIEANGLAKLAAATKNINKENVTHLHSEIDHVEKLEEAKGLWPELLPDVLWAYRITPKSITGETPYSLVYGTDAVIPVEVREPSLRYSNVSGADNDESRLQELDKAEERRDMAHVRMVAQKQQVERYYNKKAKVRSLKVDDYVLKTKTQASKDPNEAKLGTNWD